MEKQSLMTFQKAFSFGTDAGRRMKMLPRAFYQIPGTELAPKLIGKLLCCESPKGLVTGRIVEVEAYMGPLDKGAHSYGGRRTGRTAIQFGEGGYAYIYLIYGMHCCLNVVANREDCPEVVLIRALEPVSGLELMKQRRGRERELCSGPGKLCAAMGITRSLNGADLCSGPLYLEDAEEVPPDQICVSPRVNIDYAEEFRDVPWRFFEKESPFVSKVPIRFSAIGTLDEIQIV